MLRRPNKTSRQPLADGGGDYADAPAPPASMSPTSPTLVLTSAPASHANSNLPLAGSSSMMSLSKVAAEGGSKPANTPAASGWKRWFGDRHKATASGNSLMPPPMLPPKDRGGAGGGGLLSRKSRESLRTLDESSSYASHSYSSSPDSMTTTASSAAKPLPTSGSSLGLFRRRATVGNNQTNAPSSATSPPPLPTPPMLPAQASPLRAAHSARATPEPSTPSDISGSAAVGPPPQLPQPPPRHSHDGMRPAALLASSRKPWSRSVDDLSRILASVTRVKTREDAEATQQEADAEMPFPRVDSIEPRHTSAEDHIERVIDPAPAPPRTSARRKTNSFSGTTLLMNAASAVGVAPRPVAVVPMKGDDDRATGNLRKMSSPPAMMRPSESSPPLGALSSSALVTDDDQSLLAATGFGLDASNKGRAKRTTPTPAPVTTSGHVRTSSSYSLLSMGWSGSSKPKQEKPPKGKETIRAPSPRDQTTFASPIESSSPTSVTRSSKRMSQIVHRQGFILHHAASRGHAFPSPTNRMAPHDDYFGQKQDTKNWKPYKVVLRGNKLFLHKPPSEKKMAIAGVFPTHIVASQGNATAASPAQDTGKPSPEKRRRAARAYWGTSKHPALDVRPAGEASGGNVWLGRIDSATPDALAHELIFTTLHRPLVDGAQDDEQDDASYRDFCFVAALACLSTKRFDTFLRQLSTCVQRAQNLDQNGDRLAWRTQRIVSVLDNFFRPFTANDAYVELLGGASNAPAVPHPRPAPVDLDLTSSPARIAQHLSMLQRAELSATLVGSESHSVSAALTRRVWQGVFQGKGAALGHWLGIGEIARVNGDAATWIAIARAVLDPAVVRLLDWWSADNARRGQAWVDAIYSDGSTLESPRPGHVPHVGDALRKLQSDEQPSINVRNVCPLAPLMRPFLQDLSNHGLVKPHGKPTFGFDLFTHEHVMSLSLRMRPAIVHEPYASSRSEEQASPALISPLLFVDPLSTGSLRHRQALSESIQSGSTSAQMSERYREASSFVNSPRIAASGRQRRSSLPTSRRLSAAMILDRAPQEHAHKIRGRLVNNRILLGDLEVVLEVVDSAPASRPVSTLGGPTRQNSVATKRISVGSIAASLLEPLKVRIKSASLERLVDILLFGIEGTTTTLDADGMEVGGDAARRFGLDLDECRRLFFGTYQTLCKSSTLFELLRHRWNRAANLQAETGNSLDCMHWLLVDVTADDANPASGALVRQAVVDVLDCWLPGLATDVREDPAFCAVVRDFVKSNANELGAWAGRLERAVRGPALSTTLPIPTAPLPHLDFLNSDSTNIVCALDSIGAALSSGVSKQILWQSTFVIEAQLSNPLAFHPTPVPKPNAIHDFYSLASLTLGAGEDRSTFAARLPEPVERYIRFTQCLSKWLTYQIFVKPQRLGARAELLGRVVQALAIASDSAGPAKSWAVGSTFVGSVLTSVLLSVESRQSFEAWQETCKTLGVAEVSLQTLLAAIGRTAERAEMVADLGSILLRVTETLWATATTTANGQVHLDKQRTLQEVIAATPYADVAESDSQAALDNLLARLQSDTSRLVGDATKLQERRVKAVLFGNAVRDERERQQRDRIAREALVRARDARAPPSQNGNELDRLLLKKQQPRGVNRVTGALRSLHLKHSSSLLSINAAGDPLERLRKLDFAALKEPAIAIDLIGSKAAVQPNSSRSYVWSLMTELGAIFSFQSPTASEMESWVQAVNKSSEEGLLQRKAYMPPAAIQEVMEPAPTVQRLSVHNGEHTVRRGNTELSLFRQSLASASRS